jgi:AraC-like DNA-binding protein
MRAFLNTISEPNAILCCAFNDNVSFSSMLKSYPNMDWYSDSAVQELVGTKIKCFYENGDGFTYMAAISTKEYYAPLRAIIYGFCIYFIAVAIIGYSYLYSVSRRRYKELVNMIDGLPQLSNTTSSFNEVVSAVNNSLAEYKRNYAFQQRIDRRENLAKLLTGGLTESAALEQLNVAGLSQSDIGYYVVMASVDISLNMTLESSVTANTDVICLIFESSLNSLADGRLSVAVTNVPTMPRFYFFVLSILDDNFTPDDLREFLNNAIDVIEDKCTLKTSVTVSNPVTSASGLFDGYIECKKLSDFVHSIDSNATVVFQEDMQNDAGVLLNGDFLNQLQVLSRTLSVGKYELVPQLVEAMCSEHVAKLGKHYDLAHDRLWSIISILSEAISSSNLTESEKISASAQLHSVKSIAELNAITPKIFGNLSHSSDETGIDPLVKKACAYIDENISDSTLSVPQISSAVNVSVQHLSRLFKKDMDNTIVEYINYHRIEIAKKLLIEQNYTVSKIAESAGYNNTVTFTRNFKHYVGLSPSEYRNMNS